MENIIKQLEAHVATLIQEPMLEWEREMALQAWLSSKWGKKRKGVHGEN